MRKWTVWCLVLAVVTACVPPYVAPTRDTGVVSDLASDIPSVDAGNVVAPNDLGDDRPATPDAPVLVDTPDVQDASDDTPAVQDVLDVSDVPDVACPSGRTSCGGACVDTRADVAHCGACGRACATGQMCARGVCVIPESGDLATGSGHACVHIRHEDCDGVYCWGLASSCQFAPAAGDAGSTSCAGGPSPQSNTAQRVAVPGRVRQLTAAASFTCALTDEGTEIGAVYCWGRNGFGELGDGTTTSRTRPVRVMLPRSAIQIDAGNAGIAAHACAVLDDGSVYCWGANPLGELGAPPEMLGGTTRICMDFGVGYACNPSPVRAVGVTDAVQVSAGGSHTCILRENQTIVCWGNNEESALGVTTVSSYDAMHRGTVPGLNGMLQVTAGDRVTCAIGPGNVISCWGGNHACHLGTSTTTRTSVAPMRITTFSDARQVNIGFHHACAIAGGNGVWCWGYNPNSGIGNPAAVNRSCTGEDGGYSGVSPPVMVQMLPAVSVAEVRMQGPFTCARTGPREVRCWGDPSNGQLGDNRRDLPPENLSAVIPRPVADLCR